jgi:hypothetical protein
MTRKERKLSTVKARKMEKGKRTRTKIKIDVREDGCEPSSFFVEEMNEWEEVSNLID